MERISGQLLVDARLETAMLTHPLQAGWVDDAGVAVAAVTTDAAASAPLALVDSVVAADLLETHVVLRDLGLTWTTASLLTLVTHTRPDAVEQVQVAFGDVPAAGRALAMAVLTPFYGINVTEWTVGSGSDVDESHARVDGGAAALIAVDGGVPVAAEDGAEADDEDGLYQEDLGRAWFLLADLPFVSHVCICPAARLTSEPQTVAADLARLQGLLAAGQERGREVRRDLAKAHGIDRDTLTESLAGAAWSLDDDAVKGLRELYRRVGLSGAAQKLRAVWLQRPNAG